ncbi:MAG: protease modulator HflK [Eubacteriales bacterium]|jgi:membrane protease subunit HflK
MKKNTLFGDILSTLTGYFKWLVLIIVLLICVSGIRVVKSGEVAVILRFGRLVGDSYEEQVHEAGLLFAFPYIIDEVIIVPVGNVMEQKVTTHYTQGHMTNLRNNGYVITGDQNIAVVSASVKYVISDPVRYALYIKDLQTIINAFVSNAMLEEAASMPVDSLLTSEKDAYGRAVLANAQSKLNAIGAGVTISTIELTNVSMPAEVKDIYDMVNSATVQASTRIEQAKQYRENLIPQAQSTANAKIAEAQAIYSSSIAAANQDLAEFRGLLEEYNLNPDLVMTRVYNDKVTEAIKKIGKVRVVQDGETKIIIN